MARLRLQRNDLLGAAEAYAHAIRAAVSPEAATAAGTAAAAAAAAAVVAAATKKGGAMGAAEATPPREILQAAKEVLAHEAATYLRLLLAFRDGRVQELMAELMAGGEGGEGAAGFVNGGGSREARLLASRHEVQLARQQGWAAALCRVCTRAWLGLGLGLTPTLTLTAPATHVIVVHPPWQARGRGGGGGSLGAVVTRAAPLLRHADRAAQVHGAAVAAARRAPQPRDRSRAPPRRRRRALAAAARRCAGWAD